VRYMNMLPLSPYFYCHRISISAAPQTLELESELYKPAGKP